MAKQDSQIKSVKWSILYSLHGVFNDYVWTLLFILQYVIHNSKVTNLAGIYLLLVFDMTSGSPDSKQRKK